MDGSGTGSGDGASSEMKDDDVSDTFIQAILTTAKRALPLHALAPTSHWPEEQKAMWIDGLAAFTSRIAPALEAGGGAITQLVHDFINLPADILLPCIDRAAAQNPNLRNLLNQLAEDGNPLIFPDENSEDAARVRRAAKQLRFGRKGKALSALLSRGVANEHKDCVRIMQEMHPAPSRPIAKPDDLGPGLQASSKTVRKALDTLIAKDNSGIDYSGWCADWFRPARGRPDIMQPLTDLSRSIANCDDNVPVQVFWLITPGSLVALHKLDKLSRQVREAAGLDPKLRPVNKSAFLWKSATQVAIMHEEYAAAALRMQPLQLGLGAKFGMNRIAHSAQDYYALGYSSGECDGENGFNTASRQKMLEATMRESPSMTRLFYMGYCSHRPLVLLRRGNDFVVIRSAEGSRMGDQLGGFVFCLAVHPAYVEINDACPNVIFQAATDDLRSYARDPYDIVDSFPIAAAALMKHAGVRLNVSKSKILLAPSAPELNPSRVPNGVQLVRDGTIVVGAAVGTDDFVRGHAMEVVKANAEKLNGLILLDAQAALLLLSACLVPALGYLLQVTPPRLVIDAARLGRGG
jgi:hypothetical protein